MAGREEADRVTPLKNGRRGSRGGLLRDSLDVIKVKGGDGKSRYTIKPVDEKLSFDKGFYVFIRAVQLLVSRNSGPILVGLAGPSGSGKSKFSEKVSDFIPDTALISMDMYNDASRLIDSNFDDPRLTDYDLLMDNLRDLREGKTTQVPIYSFKDSKRVGYKDLQVPKSRVIIIEGIYALSDRIRPLLDLRVSITGGVHFDLVKRVLRDVDRSGQAPEEIIQQISDTVYPMYKAYIEPDLKTAHLRIYNTFNPFSGFMDATYILKTDKHASSDAIKACLKADHIYKRESEMYDIYLLPPGEDPETCQSWLRLRNKDGRYDLRFEEWVVDGPFVISPRISFEVSVKILGGLMALGYEIGSILKRNSISYSDDKITIKIDDIEGMGGKFVQVQGKDRALVQKVGSTLGFDGSYIPRSYIEQIQLNKLTDSFQTVPEDLRAQFDLDGGPDDSPLGKSPLMESPFFRRTTGFAISERPTLASSAPTSISGGILRSSSEASHMSGLISQQLKGIPENGFSQVSSRAPSHHQGSDANSGHSSDDCSDEAPLFTIANGHHNIQTPNTTKKGDEIYQLRKLERMVHSLSDQVEKINRRPDHLTSQIDVQLQALTAQQQNLQKQIQELPEALQKLQERFELKSSKEISRSKWDSVLQNPFTLAVPVIFVSCITAFAVAKLAAKRMSKVE